MLIAQNVFQGFAVAYFRLQTLIRVGLFFVAAYYAFQFHHLVYARRQQFAKSLKLICLLSLCPVKFYNIMAFGDVAYGKQSAGHLWECPGYIPSVVVTGGLVLTWRQDICNYHADISWSVSFKSP